MRASRIAEIKLVATLKQKNIDNYTERHKRVLRTPLRCFQKVPETSMQRWSPDTSKVSLWHDSSKVSKFSTPPGVSWKRHEVST